MELSKQGVESRETVELSPEYERHRKKLKSVYRVSYDEPQEYNLSTYDTWHSIELMRSTSSSIDDEEGDVKRFKNDQPLSTSDSVFQRLDVKWNQCEQSVFPAATTSETKRTFQMELKSNKGMLESDNDGSIVMISSSPSVQTSSADIKERTQVESLRKEHDADELSVRRMHKRMVERQARLKKRRVEGALYDEGSRWFNCCRQYCTMQTFVFLVCCWSRKRKRDWDNISLSKDSPNWLQNLKISESLEELSRDFIQSSIPRTPELSCDTRRSRYWMSTTNLSPLSSSLEQCGGFHKEQGVTVDPSPSIISNFVCRLSSVGGEPNTRGLGHRISISPGVWLEASSIPNNHLSKDPRWFLDESQETPSIDQGEGARWLRGTNGSFSFLPTMSLVPSHKSGRWNQSSPSKNILCNDSNTSLRSEWTELYQLDSVDSKEKMDPDFVNKCHAFVVAKKLYEPPISVDEFLETRVEPSDDHATRIIKAWAYLSCYSPLDTNKLETRPKELNLHPGVIVRMLTPPVDSEKDPLRICSSWDSCSGGLLHFYRSRHNDSNCNYHLYLVWKETVEMEKVFSTKLLNLLALGNHSKYSIYNNDLSVQGDFFKLAMNVFAKNTLVGSRVGHAAVVISDQAILKSLQIRTVNEFNSYKTFRNLLQSWDKRGEAEYDMEGYQLYDEAKLLAPCIFSYLQNYSSMLKGRSILFKPCRMHSRSHYEMLCERIYDKALPNEPQVSFLSAPLLVSNWLTAVFYFDDPMAIHEFIDMLGEDPLIEIVTIEDQMNMQSLVKISLIVKNLELLGKPSDASMSSFFVEVRLQFYWSWYFKLQTFRLEQMSVCSPEQLLVSRKTP